MSTASTSRAAAASRRGPDPYQWLMRPLAGGLAATALALVFALVAGVVLTGDSRALDEWALQLAREARARHAGLGDLMADLSSLGSTVVVTLVTLTTVGYLLLASRRVTALLVALSVTGGAAGLTLLKHAVARARPASEFAERVVAGMSFPSGHASMSAIVFLTLGALVAGTRAHAAERLYVLAVAGAATMLVGLSRVALGVHWLTDVVGGWALGSAWALGWLLVAHRIDRPGSALAREAS